MHPLTNYNDVTMPPVTDEVQLDHRFLPGVEHSGESSLSCPQFTLLTASGVLWGVSPGHSWSSILHHPTTAGAVIPDHHQVLLAPRC